MTSDWDGSICDRYTSVGEAGNAIQRNLDFSMTHQLQLPYDFNIELVSFYNTPFYLGVVRIGQRAGLDIGLRKKFKHNSSLAFNVTDLFNSSSFYNLEADALDQGMYYNWTWNSEGRVFRLSFSMPFGNQQMKTRSRHSTDSSEELNRLN